MARRSFEYSKLEGLRRERYSYVGYLESLTRTKEDVSRSLIIPVPATGPEKMVYNFLLRLGVRFQYLYHAFENPETLKRESVWIPDFILPDYNIIIEVFGYFWHSNKIRREDDLIKRAYFMLAGYQVYEYGKSLNPSTNTVGKLVIWWDWEIYQDLARLFFRDIPEVIENPIKGQPDPYLWDREIEETKLKEKAARVKIGLMVPKAPELPKLIRPSRTRDLLPYDRTIKKEGIKKIAVKKRRRL